MKKPFTLVAALLVGSLYFTGCQSSKTPTSGSSTSTSTASPDNSSYRTSSNNTGNNDPSNMSNGGTPERVGTGTASGSTISTSPSPGVTIPLGTGSANGGQTGNTAIENSANSTTNQAVTTGNSPGMTTNTGTSSLGGTGATGSMNQNSTTSEVTLSNPSSAMGTQSTNPNRATSGATTPRTGAVTAPAGNENWSANRNNPVRQSDAMDNNGVSGGQNTGVATDTTGKVSSTLTPAPAASNLQEAQRNGMQPGNANQRAPERMSMDGERNAATGAKPASGQSTTMAPSERERMGRNRTTQAGMEQQRTAQQMNTTQGGTTPESAIYRLTKQLDAIDEELEKKTSARRRSTLMKQRKNLMLALGKAKAAQLPVPE